jgi:predicted PurR-regulated permease PerM
MKLPFEFPFYAKASLVFIGLLAFIAVLYLTQSILVPLIYSTIIAIVLCPIVNFLVRKKFPRIIAISFTLLLLIVVSLSALVILTRQAAMFSESFPNLVNKLDALLRQSEAWVHFNFHISNRKISSWINETNVELLDGSRVLLGQTLLNIGGILVVLFLVPVYIFMLLYYQPLLITFIHKLFNDTNSEKVSDILLASKRIIQSYLIGLLLEGLIVAILNSACLLILGIDYAILLGVMGAIFNVIPLIGGALAIALPLLIALATKTPTHAVLVVCFYVVIQFIDNHFIIPKVVASKVKINALISIIVVIASGALWGIAGMFLAIPLAAILKVIFDHIDELKPWGYLLGNVISEPTIKEKDVIFE